MLREGGSSTGALHSANANANFLFSALARGKEGEGEEDVEESPPSPVAAFQALVDMCSMTEIRGGQSAGSCIVKWDSGSAAEEQRFREVVAKRSKAVGVLERAFRWKKFTAGTLVMCHLRFATSSRNVRQESHPHLWTPWHREASWRWTAEGRMAKVRAKSGHVITHNGDFDAVYLYDSPVSTERLGRWLGKVLGREVTLDSDSVKIAGYFEVFSTAGSWSGSARRAWVMEVATCLDDALRSGSANVEHAASCPRRETVEAWGKFFEEEFEASELLKINPFVDPGSFKAAFFTFSSDVLVSLSSRRLEPSLKVSDWTDSQLDSFVSSTIMAFFTSDAYSTMASFLETASGSFGLAVCCAAEPSSVVLAAMGQPMCFAVDPDADAVLYGSEANAVKVPYKLGQPLRFRYDLDDQGGEAVRVGKPNLSNYLGDLLDPDRSFHPKSVLLSSLLDSELSFFSLTDDMIITDPAQHIASKFIFQPSAVSIPHRDADLVLNDINDIPAVLRNVTLDWSDASSTNRQAAVDFFHLFSDCIRRHREGERGLDLLLTGIESSLWLAEQLAADLRIIFPNASINSVSSNKLLGALEDVPRMVHFCGYNRLRADDLRRDRPVVLCISQSGQTFATLHACRQLLNVLEGNVFLVTGTKESKMRDAVVDLLGEEAGDRRVMYNFSGVRLAEPSTVAVCSMHQTLTEFLLLVAQCACASAEVALSAKLNVKKEDLVDFRDIIDSLHDDLPGMVDRGNPINIKLRAQGVTWAKHITEQWRCMVLSGIYIAASVISGYPIFRLLFAGARVEGALTYVLRALDATVYVFLPKIFSYLLRIIEGRTILARHGKRSLLICDVPYVHKNLENYVTKLFALSYGFISVEVHGAEAHDDMVHTHTHRVVRGALMALGRPEGRLLSLLKTEQTIMLAAKQAAFIENMAVGPEVFTVGHNAVQSSIAAHHICIPSSRRKFLSESLYDYALSAKASHGNFRAEDFERATKQIMDQLGGEDLNRVGAAFPRRLLPVGAVYASPPFSPQEIPRRTSSTDDFAEEVLALTVNTPSDEFSSEDFNLRDPLKGSKHATPNLSLDARYTFAMKLPRDVRKKVDRSAPLEHLYESRVASFERLIAMLIVFHEMADHCSTPWLLPKWDISRSQSNLRVATTACPVSVEDDDIGEEIMSNTSEFDASVHIINESKRRLSFSLTTDTFPASIVAQEEEIETKVIQKNNSIQKGYKSVPSNLSAL